MNTEANRSVATSARTRRTVLCVAIAVVATIPIATGSSGASDEPTSTGPDGLVTEEVEPGVERIISDGAGHDLDEGHPDFHYDLDRVTVADDGTVLLQSTYHGSDNDANRPGALLWTLGEPGTFRLPDDFFYALTERTIPMSFFCDTTGVGVICIHATGEATTTYLAGTPINDVSVAPDGTIWAVGDYDGESGGLYRITHERLTTN